MQHVDNRVSTPSGWHCTPRHCASCSGAQALPRHGRAIQAPTTAAAARTWWRRVQHREARDSSLLNSAVWHGCSSAQQRSGDSRAAVSQSWLLKQCGIPARQRRRRQARRGSWAGGHCRLMMRLIRRLCTSPLADAWNTCPTLVLRASQAHHRWLTGLHAEHEAPVQAAQQLQLASHQARLELGKRGGPVAGQAAHQLQSMGMQRGSGISRPSNS